MEDNAFCLPSSSTPASKLYVVKFSRGDGSATTSTHTFRTSRAKLIRWTHCCCACEGCSACDSSICSRQLNLRGLDFVWPYWCPNGWRAREVNFFARRLKKWDGCECGSLLRTYYRFSVTGTASAVERGVNFFRWWFRWQWLTIF